MIIPEGAPKDEYQMFMTLEDTTTQTVVEIDMQQYARERWNERKAKYKFLYNSEK